MSSNVPERFGPEDLLVERGLFDIYKKCKRLPRGWFNSAASGVVAVALIAHMLMTTADASQIAQYVRSLLDVGLGFAASILGFLLAGFAIFATMTKPALLVKMARTPYKDTGLSYLKVNYFALMEVFIVYSWFVAACFLGKLFLIPGGSICFALEHLHADVPTIKVYLAKAAYVLLGTAFIYLVLLLSCFIFNVYHIVMTGIRWDVEETIRSESRGDDAPPAQQNPCVE
jgi:hypothetical protein